MATKTLPRVLMKSSLEKTNEVTKKNPQNKGYSNVKLEMSQDKANFLLKKWKAQVNRSVNDIEVLIQCDPFPQISAYKTQ